MKYKMLLTKIKLVSRQTMLLELEEKRDMVKRERIEDVKFNIYNLKLYIKN